MLCGAGYQQDGLPRVVETGVVRQKRRVDDRERWLELWPFRTNLVDGQLRERRIRVGRSRIRRGKNAYGGAQQRYQSCGAHVGVHR